MNKGLALQKIRQCSKTAPPAANSGKYGGGALSSNEGSKTVRGGRSHTQVKPSQKGLLGLSSSNSYGLWSSIPTQI